MTKNPSLSARQAMLYLEQLLQEPVHASPTADELVDAFAAGDTAIPKLLFNAGAVDQMMTLADDQRAIIAAHLARICDRIEVGVARQGQAVANSRADIARHDLETHRQRADEADALLAQTPVAVGVTDRLRELATSLDRQDGQAAPAPAATPSEPLPSPAQRAKPSKVPLWSAVEASFLAEKTRVVPGHRSYDAQTVRQTESTLHLWRSLVGDRPMSEYTGADAGTYRDLMLRMPASHGKGGTRSAVRKVLTPLEAIRATDEKQKAIEARNANLTPGAPREADIPRLGMKTLKRHFSTLSQLWIHAGRLGHVPKEPNIFRGWEYQGVKRGQKKRGPWSVSDLNLLLSSSWFGPERTGCDDWWVTLIAMWHGLRVEEIVRLRPAEDIQVVDGIPSLVVQEHAAPDRWSPKTEAGERVVPIHSRLLGLGIMDLVEARRADGARRLFPSYVFRPSSNKLSAKFVSDFSRMKTGLGIGDKTTFHSFRHNISTILRNTALSSARESWIDAVLGHEGGEDEDGRKRVRSVGATVYLAEIGIGNLKATVEAIRYPEGVDLSRLTRS